MTSRPVPAEAGAEPAPLTPLPQARRQLVAAAVARMRTHYGLAAAPADLPVQGVTMLGGDVARYGELCHLIGADAARYALVRTRRNRPARVDLEVWSRRDERNPMWRMWYAGVSSRELLDVAGHHGVTPAQGGTLEERVCAPLVAALDALGEVGRAAAQRAEPHRLADHLEHDVTAAQEAVRRWSWTGLSTIRDDPTGHSAAAYRSHLALLARCAADVAGVATLVGVPMPRRL